MDSTEHCGLREGRIDQLLMRLLGGTKEGALIEAPARMNILYEPKDVIPFVPVIQSFADSNRAALGFLTRETTCNRLAMEGFGSLFLM